MVRFKCRQCGGRMEAPASQIGKAEHCPVCGAVMAVPRRLPWGRIAAAVICTAVLIGVAIAINSPKLAKPGTVSLNSPKPAKPPGISFDEALRWDESRLADLVGCQVRGIGNVWTVAGGANQDGTYRLEVNYDPGSQSGRLHDRILKLVLRCPAEIAVGFRPSEPIETGPSLPAYTGGDGARFAPGFMPMGVREGSRAEFSGIVSQAKLVPASGPTVWDNPEMILLELRDSRVVTRK